MGLKLKLDGKEVPTNQYVELVFTGVNEALIKTLRDVGEWKRAEITLEKEEK